jgi:hypothetical protein
MNTLDATGRTDPPSESPVDEDAWRISVLDEVIEPVLMASDYKTLLAEASGRVIILSNFAECPYWSSLFFSQPLMHLKQARLLHSCP